MSNIPKRISQRARQLADSIQRAPGGQPRPFSFEADGPTVVECSVILYQDISAAVEELAPITGYRARTMPHPAVIDSCVEQIMEWEDELNWDKPGMPEWVEDAFFKWLVKTALQEYVAKTYPR